MGLSSKTAKIIKDAEENGTPIFILTAKDKLAMETLDEYLMLCASNNCTSQHTDDVKNRMDEFEEWQNNNQDKVKLPD